MSFAHRISGLGLSLATGLLALLLGAGDCSTPINTDDAGTPDAGPTLLLCDDTADCPDDGVYDCVGFCKKQCAADTVCAAADFCNPQSGYCEPGCRTGGCAESEVCLGGVCRERTGAGCTDRCECAAGEICAGGVCGPPPAVCETNDDCGRGPTSPTDRCEDVACNGISDTCFLVGDQTCASVADCAGRPQCQGGCVCSGQGADSRCVPSVACTLENEATTCGQGFYCTAGNTCAENPTCTGNAECAAANLVCNQGLGRCERPLPCTSSADCTTPGAPYCNTTVQPALCAQPTCLNGGTACTGGQVCAPTGACVVQGTGDPCTSDLTCPSDQYCALVGASGACALGCRTNANCNNGQQCNGANQCVSGGGGGQFGDSCSDSSECQAGLTCGLLSGTCAEQCEQGCTPGVDCCQLSGAPRCNSLGFCSNI